jgi:hypothetical protein
MHAAPRWCCVAALHESTETAAAEGVRDVVVFHCTTASARPVVEGGERGDSHANAGGVLESFVAQVVGGSLMISF